MRHYTPGRMWDQLAVNVTVVLTSGSLVHGTSHTFTATVASTGGFTPQGTVQFYDDGAPLGGPQTLVAGAASISTSGLAVGANTISATYTPNDGIHDSGSGQTIVTLKYATTTTVVLLSNPVQYGQASQTVRVTVAGGSTPSGTVDLTIAGVYFGSASLNGSGYADFAIGDTRSVGTYALAADYGGDSTHFASNGTGSFTINQATVTCSLSATPTTTYGETWSYTATLTSSTGATVAGGDVEFYDVDNAGVHSTIANSGGSAVESFTATERAPGTYTFKAKFNGSTNFAASAYSSNVAHTIDKQTTMTTLVSTSPLGTSGDPGLEGVPWNFDGTVSFSHVARDGGTVNLYQEDQDSTVLLVGTTTVLAGAFSVSFTPNTTTNPYYPDAFYTFTVVYETNSYEIGSSDVAVDLEYDG